MEESQLNLNTTGMEYITAPKFGSLQYNWASIQFAAVFKIKK
jgi:hypothetical protein